ncbi:MAG: aminoglycoside phosphotransferase family protein [Acidimicrobiales bacterium]
MTVDPHDPGAVADALCGWAAARFGGDVGVVGTPASIGAGFDSYIHLVDLAGEHLPPTWRVPLVVRLLPSVDRLEQAHREAAVQGWAAAQGFAAPAVLEVLAPGEPFGLPAQVMERAPGTTMLDALSARPWRALALVRQLAALQLALHALPLDGWPSGTDPRQLVDQRLGLPRRAAGALGDPDLTDALERVAGVFEIATGGHAVVCHGDFHPLNVVVDGPQASVIDWTDAGLGPREADVARTVLIFHVAAIAASGAVERVALRVAGPWLARRYRHTYEATAPLDPTRMRAWEALHALHGWAQVRMLHSGGFDGESSSDAARVPPELADFLRGRFEEAIAAV